MGSPLAPVLVNSFVGFHESQWLNEYNLNKPKFNLRYVDEIVAAFDNEQDSLDFLNFQIIGILTLNSLQKIKLTIPSLFLMYSFSSFKIKNYFSYKDTIPNDLKSFLVQKFTCSSCSSSYILKLGLRSISKRITSLIFLNICTPLKHAFTHIILFVLKQLIRLTLNST